MDYELEPVDESVGTSVHMGFPNAAVDTRLTGLDISQLLIKRPHSTFFMRISGNQWSRDGIFDGDIAIIDRALNPQVTDLVVWWQEDNEFAISLFSRVRKGCPVWGVVTNIIHQFR